MKKKIKNIATRIESPSSINTYLQCPFKYYLAYIVKYKQENNKWFSRGTILHNTSEKFYSIPLHRDESPAYFKRHLTEIFEREWYNHYDEFKALGLPSEEYQELYKESQKMVEHFYFYNIEKIKKWKRANKYSIQEIFTKYIRPVYMELDLDDYDIMLRGFIDRVDVTIEGKLRIIDYKTSGKTTLSDSMYRQLVLYLLLLKRQKNLLADEIGIYFYKDNSEPTITVNENMLEDAYQIVHYHHLQTQSRDIIMYPKKKSGLCKYCGYYKKHCNIDLY